MRRFPIIWWPLALAVLITSRCAIGSLTKSQLQQIINTILYEDELYYDVLSEEVKLDESDTLLPWTNIIVNNIKHVDPLKVLLALSLERNHYSGYDLNLGTTIIGKSISCLVHKRVAVHLSLIIGIIDSKDLWVKFKTRITIFTYVIVYYIDILCAIYKKYDQLLNMYNMLNGMVKEMDTVDDAMYEDFIKKLKEQLNILINVIQSSCVVNDMKQYCSSLNLKIFKNCAHQINDENIVSNLDLDTSIKVLMENENAIMNFYEEMDLFRSMKMETWKVLLDVPEFPDTKNKTSEIDIFERVPLPPKHRNEVAAIIDAIHHHTEKEDATIEILVEGVTTNSEASCAGTP